MRPWLAVMLLLAACQRVFKLDEVPPIGDGGADATADGSGSACPTSGPRDDFSGIEPCAVWGTVVKDPQVAVQSGQGTLRVLIDAQGGQGGCMLNGALTLTADGIFIEVPQPLDTGSAYTVFHAFAQTPGDASATIFAANGGVVLFDENARANVSAAMPDTQARWWRLRAIQGGIAGDLSSDGKTWTSVGAVPGTVGPVAVYLQAGVTTPNDPTGIATFAHFDECP